MQCKKPPMGWNSWNTFSSNINEQLILDSADAILQAGLDKVGYNYIVIDDCWLLKKRGKDGRQIPDPEKFPNGIKALADKIHEKGLKFGIYSCCGFMTCAQYPSSLDREWIDAQTYAEWGVDYLKYDYCFKPTSRKGEELYRTMGLALANSGRDILFSACSWGADKTHEWIRGTGANMWRSTGDIVDSWRSIKVIIMQQSDRLAFGGKDCFNDMDMMVVGMNGKGNVGVSGCTEEEYKTHFAAWCLLGSPLMIGCDVRNMDDFTVSLLKNPVLLSINQDEKCSQVFPLHNYFWDGDHEETPIYARLLENGDVAIGFLNLMDVRRELIVEIADLGINLFSGKAMEFVDCWTGETGYTEDSIRVVLEPHCSVVFRCKVVDKRDEE